MAGILDFLNSPDAQLGIGLLAAGGPTTDPNQTGLGQRIAAAQKSVAAQQGTQLDLQMKKAQMDQLGFALKKNQFLMDMAQQAMNPNQGGDFSGQAAQTSAAGGMPPQGMGAPAAGGAMDAPQGATPAAQSAPAGGSMFGNIPRKVAAFSMLTDPNALNTAMLSQYAPTDFQKMMSAAGIDPNSALGRQMLQQNLAKQNYTAPVNARPGSILRDPFTNQPLAFNPHVPDNSSPVFDASGNVVAMKPINGADAAIAAVEAAKGRGKQESTPTVAFGPGNKPIFSTGGQDLDRANGTNAALQGLPPAQGGMTSSFEGPAEKVLPLIAAMKDPQERANAYDAYSRQLTGSGPTQGAASTAVTPVLPPGADKGAVLSQEELSKKGQSLTADNSSANTVISRLQNIKLLAPGAITGAESSRRDFYNGLLSLAGIKGTEDAKTASDLVDKNSAQIVTALRMGQGGAGTDALQTLLGAANPNRHMTVEAINDAADQLIASQKMNQAKAKLLTPHVLARDPVAYGQKELAFDQAADPRVFQLNSMNDDQAKAYIKKLSPDDAKALLQSRAQLKALGAL